MKQYECLVPGCNWHTKAEDSAEVVRRATEHLRAVHGETEIFKRPRHVGFTRSRQAESDKQRRLVIEKRQNIPLSC